MKILLTQIKSISSLATFALLVNIFGCKAGFDVEALPLDNAQIINYGANVIAHLVPPEAEVYGQLMPGTSEERSREVLGGEARDISRCIGNLRNLTKDFAFGSTENNFTAWVDKFQTDFAKDAPSIYQARAGTAALQNLVVLIEAEVKTAGKLATRINDGEKLIPDDAKQEYDRITKNCVQGYERIYQTGIVLAQSLAQKEGLDNLSKVQSALHTLADNGENRLVFADMAKRDAGLFAVDAANSRALSARVFIDGMTKKNKTSTGLNNAVYELETALNRVESDYVNNADATMRPEAKTLIDNAMTAVKALKKLASEYGSGIEKLKGAKADLRLDDLTTKAFTVTTSAFLGDFSLDQETQINEMTRLLGSFSVLILSQDDSSGLLIDALASSVVSGVAAQYGLSDVANVVGLLDSALIKAKADFGMSPEDFAKYATSRAKKIREALSQGGKHKNVYVIFADALFTEGADVSALIDQFAGDKGKVIIVTATPNKYVQRGKFFESRNLDITAAILAGNAVLGQYDKLPVSEGELSEMASVLALGLGGKLKLGGLAPLMNAAALRVMALKNPTKTAVENAVREAASAQGVPTNLIGSSGILRDSAAKVQANLRVNRDYYIMAGSGRGAAQIEADIRREEILKNLQQSQLEQSRRESSRQELNDTIAKANNSINAMKAESTSMNAIGRAGSAVTITDREIDKISRHLDLIDEIAKDRACSEILLKVNKGVITVPCPISVASLAGNNKYYFNIVGNFDYPGNAQAKATMEQLGLRLAPRMLDAVKHRTQISNALSNSNVPGTNELPYASINCFAVGNVPQKIKDTTSTIRAELNNFEVALRGISSVVSGEASDQQIGQVSHQLRLAQGGLKDAIRSKIEDFSSWNAFAADYWDTAWNNTFGKLAGTVGASGDPYRQFNRRIYAYLFSMVVGKIQHASIPKNADAELYSGFVDNDVFVKQITDALAPIDLNELVARTLLFKEIAKLLAVYGDVIRKVYDLSYDDREAFEKNAVANDFLPFFNKIKSIIDDKSYVADIKNLDKNQVDLRNEVYAKVLPDEVMTMLNLYPAWHPHAYFTAAVNRIYNARWGGLAFAGNEVVYRTDFDTDFPAGTGQFSIPAPADTFIKDQAVLEYESLRELANSLALGGPKPSAAAERAALAGFYPPAFPAASALKTPRFNTASLGNGATHLDKESDGVKRLVPIWDDLVNLAQRIYASADKIYFYLTLIKKS